MNYGFGKKGMVLRMSYGLGKIKTNLLREGKVENRKENKVEDRKEDKVEDKMKSKTRLRRGQANLLLISTSYVNAQQVTTWYIATSPLILLMAVST